MNIWLANGKSYQADGTRSILDAARDSGLVLEYSCRTGRCGTCVAKVVSGKTELLTVESSITNEKLESDCILTCCRAPASDIELDIEDLGDLASYIPKTMPARIHSIKLVSPDIIQVSLRTPPSIKLEYRAGQYIDLIGPEGVRRSYSLANAPHANGKLELDIRKVDNGKLSQYWFNEAKVNDLLRLEGPLGTFCLRNKPVSTLVLLATGTGIAPIKAILEELDSNDAPLNYEFIRVYWGGRVEEDLYWEPDFQKLPLQFIKVLSRAPKSSSRHGYVQDALVADGVDLTNSAVYACGSKAMIDSAKASLIELGLSEKQFYSDAFVSSS
jgi:CDP-4-dehydro-6-deoxyglucose reductase, E3